MPWIINICVQGEIAKCLSLLKHSMEQFRNTGLPFKVREGAEDRVKNTVYST